MSAHTAILIFFRVDCQARDLRAAVQDIEDVGAGMCASMWTGISIAREGERYGLLSLGMKQFELPDLLLMVPPAKTNDAIPFMLDLLGMVVKSGKPLPEGDTVGRSATEKLAVHYVISPVDPKTKVWRVEMK